MTLSKTRWDLRYAEVRPRSGLYDEVARLRNADLVSQRRTPVEIERADAIGTHRFRRAIACHRGRSVGMLRVMEAFWANTPGRADYVVYLDPEFECAELYAELVEECENTARRWEMLRTSIQEREAKPERCAELERRGYEAGLVEGITGLNLVDFDPSPFEPWVRATREAGVQIKSSEDFDRHGVDWLKPLYELDQIASKDMPSLDGFELEPFDEYVQHMRRLKPLCYFALAEGRFVGVPMLIPCEADPSEFGTGFTGVLREWRRHGIATTLKLCAIQRAKELGGRLLTTGNATSNPMYELNLRLGYRPIDNWVEYVRDL